MQRLLYEAVFHSVKNNKMTPKMTFMPIKPSVSFESSKRRHKLRAELC